MYLLDANIFIRPYNNYYKMDLFPSYWDELSKHSSLNFTISSRVSAEILVEDDDSMKDELQLWMENYFNGNTESELQDSILTEHQNVMNHILNSPYYNQNAFDTWSNPDVADPWLIAMAKALSLPLVTLETPHPKLDPNSPTKKVKIPDVCQQLGVECLTLNDLLHNIGLVI